MGSKGSLSAYCLLKMQMKEIEKSNKKKVKMDTSKMDQNSTTNDSSQMDTSKMEQNSTTNDTKSTPDVTALNESKPETKDNSPSIPPVNKKDIYPVDKKKTLSGARKQKLDPNKPLSIYGDFYCAICDAHMNSEDMWKSHVIGKRHKKNLNKGKQESKYEDLDIKSSVEYELRNVKDAIVGLSYIQETRKREVGVPSLYACFLCQSNFATVPMVIDHLISIKHKLNYIKEKSPEDYKLLDAVGLKKPQLAPLVTEMAVKLEEIHGRGAVKVKKEKQKQPYVPTKQFTKIEKDIERTPKSQKHFDVWKPVGNPTDKFLDNVKDCRLIIEERRKQGAISVEKTGMLKQSHSDSNHFKRHRSPSPYSGESYKREKTYSRNRYSSYKDYRSYSRSPSRESPRNNSHSSRKDVYSSPDNDGFHSRNNCHSSRKDVYSSPDNDGFHSRSSELEQKDFSSSKNYSYLENESIKPNSSDSDAQRKFCLKIFALPTDLFLKVANVKLESIQIKGVDDLAALVRAIKKAQSVFHKNFPSDLQTIVREKMLNNKTESSPTPVLKRISQDAASSSKRKSDLSFLSELINKAKGKCLPSSVASPPYNDASSTMAPSGISELRNAHRQSYSASNTEQSQYFDSSSSSNYLEYKYF